MQIAHHLTKLFDNVADLKFQENTEEMLPLGCTAEKRSMFCSMTNLDLMVRYVELCEMSFMILPSLGRRLNRHFQLPEMLLLII